MLTYRGKYDKLNKEVIIFAERIAAFSILGYDRISEFVGKGGERYVWKEEGTSRLHRLC